MCRADASAAAPDSRAEQRDEILQAIREVADPEMTGRLKHLSSADWEALVDGVACQMGDELSERLDEQTTRAVLLEVVRSWLDHHEQQRRHRARRQR
jgi:hypothetical protein